MLRSSNTVYHAIVKIAIFVPGEVHYSSLCKYEITIFVPSEVQYSSLCKCKNYNFLYQVKCNTVRYANVKITIFCTRFYGYISCSPITQSRSPHSPNLINIGVPNTYRHCTITRASLSTIKTMETVCYYIYLAL